MSLTSLDGLLPSTFKKLLAGEMPGLKSAHLSEAMAAGCGYRNNAAYLTDLRSAGPVTFVAVDRVDSMAMSQRLIEITRDKPDDVTSLVAGTLARIHAHVRGDIVPIGLLSAINVNRDALPRYATGRELYARFAHDRPPVSHAAIGDIVEPVMDRIRFDDDPETWKARARQVLEALLPAFKWIVLPRSPSAGDLSLALSTSMLSTIARGGFAQVPDSTRPALAEYLDDLPDTAGLAALDRHKVVADAIRRVLLGMILARELPRGWTDYGSGRHFDPRTESGIHKVMDRLELDELCLTLQGLIETGGSDAPRRAKDRAHALAKVVCDCVGMGREVFTSVDLERAATLEFISGPHGRQTTIRHNYLASLPLESGDTPSPEVTARHSEAERLFLDALGQPAARDLVPVD